MLQKIGELTDPALALPVLIVMPTDTATVLTIWLGTFDRRNSGTSAEELLVFVFQGCEAIYYYECRAFLNCSNPNTH